ncbi:uncharacterized protein LOC113211585 isoform X2 [Frankliniella occidentalis]|uniref:Uncharacterized protein LOC113211585 isoform X2 n=1 Tax=Frankliniella occidentalis TaxID=133901 RepID=A0A9C6WYL5_FRAOC|nr:uncharacterized protein LOC113211585 isoform X2 [Frankliniella occidentalis]
MLRSASPVARCRRDGLDRGPPGPELHSSSKMVQYALLMLLLPLAVVASCPCPPAPDASAKVCGSNHHTYDSTCHLECAKVPGLTVSHSGPCSALDMARRLLTANGTHPRRRPARSASEDYKKYKECDRNCGRPSCGCQADEWDCNRMCYYNCRCSSCLGIPGGDLDSGDKWSSCVKERGCLRTWHECWDSCTTRDCADACELDRPKCECGCMEVARGNASEEPVDNDPSRFPYGEEPSASPALRPALGVDIAINQPPAPPGTGPLSLKCSCEWV